MKIKNKSILNRLIAIALLILAILPLSLLMHPFWNKVINLQNEPFEHFCIMLVCMVLILIGKKFKK